ncbi:YodC family protein [Bradyrhizobium sp. STM 3566]|uniref:YodC family protein n=1 Tax=Bradyrhizobium sp. STM 3566 TaxID=578928 RepID=UPI00388F044D
MAEFKKGDTVKLKSGGPVMTISNANSSGGCTCYWFNVNGTEYTPKWETFAPEMLDPVHRK